MVRDCRPPEREPGRSWLGRRSTMATSTPANANSPANISPVGPPPAITTPCSVIATLPPRSPAPTWETALARDHPAEPHADRGDPGETAVPQPHQVRVRLAVPGLEHTYGLAHVAVRQLVLEGDPPAHVLRPHRVLAAGHRGRNLSPGGHAIGRRARERVRVHAPGQDLQPVHNPGPGPREVRRG